MDNKFGPNVETLEMDLSFFILLPLEKPKALQNIERLYVFTHFQGLAI